MFVFVYVCVCLCVCVFVWNRRHKPGSELGDSDADLRGQNKIEAYVVDFLHRRIKLRSWWAAHGDSLSTDAPYPPVFPEHLQLPP